MDLIRTMGEMALASRLRALSDALMQDAAALYADLGHDFEPRFFGMFQALLLKSPQGITEIAQNLGLTHTAVRKTANELIARGWVLERPDARDERRRPLALTPRGRRLARRLAPVWEAFREASVATLEEAGVDLLADVTRVEDVCAQQTIADRVRRKLGIPVPAAIQVEDYRPAYKKHFRRLNEAWIEEFFHVEPADARLLGDPNRFILKRGGCILFALRRNEVVGTCALLRHRLTNGRKAPGRAADRAAGHRPRVIWELTKMAVDADHRRQGIGRALLTAIVPRAANAGAKEIYLQTHPRLTAAGRLYRHFGFRKVTKGPLVGDCYARGGYVMRLPLRDSLDRVRDDGPTPSRKRVGGG